MTAPLTFTPASGVKDASRDIGLLTADSVVLLWTVSVGQICPVMCQLFAWLLIVTRLVTSIVPLSLMLPIWQ